MTLRFSLNNLYLNANSASHVLWHIYRFMTAVSPTGPGWVSIGESNGTTGGMGTTGIITSESSLTSGTSWFVLRSPDSKIQILFARSSTSSTYAAFYLTYQQFSGGSSTTFPTYNASSTLIFAAAQRIVSTIYNRTLNLMADDAYPYLFYATSTIVTTNVPNNGYGPYSEFGIFYIPLDGYEINDGYPYVFMVGGGGNAGLTSSYIGTNIDTSYGAKAFNYNGTSKNICPPLLQRTYNTTPLPQAMPKVGDGYQIYGVPMIFSGAQLYKGVTYKFGWAATSPLFSGRTFDNKKWICFSDIICPWDGVTTPLLCYNG